MNGNVKCKNLYEFLKTLSPAILSRLYLKPSACLAILREMPELARLYVMRLLYIEHSVFQAVVCSWVQPNKIEVHQEAVQSLSDLHIWSQTGSATGNLPGWLLCPSFRASLKAIMQSSSDKWMLQALPDRTKDIAALEQYSTERWENILHYMVGNATPISQDVIAVLLHGGLMTPDSSSNSQHSHIITKEGFQFVLLDVVSQVWHFVVQYLSMLQESEVDLVECLNFLFQLSFTTMGKSYSIENFSPSLLTFVKSLREFGLVFQRKKKSKRIFPTRLAINLSSGQTLGLAAADIPGFLIVQTTFQVTAYTDSLLKIALLALFTEMNYRFPSVCIGIITRESVRQAFKYGITAEQIINFLKTHSRSPKEATPDNLVPSGVIDQIKLWELERNRLSFVEGVLYNHFLSSNDFHRLEEYAKDINGLIFSNSQSRVMVVCKSAHEDVRKFWKRQKQDH